ncbi:MAG TPA: GNAT family N-acetyltransferase, partial [Rhodothermales bacterium]
VASDADWQRVKAIRTAVFIEEQACPPDEEWDEFDAVSRHFLGSIGDEAIATARWRVALHEERSVAKLERFAVLRPWRGRGFGRELVAAVMHDAARAGFRTYFLHAQAHLEDFYRSMGFVTVSGRFMEASIPHVAMLRVDPDDS